ncbi:hypothetical protein P7C70_g6286, partial [Phenoliferia sp. Uapishka_3]
MLKSSNGSHEDAIHEAEKGQGAAVVLGPKTPEERAYVASADDALALLDLVSTESPYHPIHWALWKRWALISIYCLLQVFVTILSTDYVSVEFLVSLLSSSGQEGSPLTLLPLQIQEKWGGTTQVVTLGQSLFIIGTAVGPAFLGPASDILGRKWLYVGAIVVYSLVNIASESISLDIDYKDAVALCNVAGTIADLFGDQAGAGQAMALFASSANIGPSIGSPIGEWIADNPHMGFAWMGWLNVIIGFAFAIGMAFLPETLPSIVIARAAKKEHGDEVGEILATTNVSVLKETVFIFTMAMKIMCFEVRFPCFQWMGPSLTLSAFQNESLSFCSWVRFAYVVCEFVLINSTTFSGIYNGFAYGLLFLYLDGVFDVFSVNNGLSYIGADLTYLNFVVGLVSFAHNNSYVNTDMLAVGDRVVIMFCFFVPLQTWLVKRDRAKSGGIIRPEARFLLSLVTVWGFPCSLFWFAFTSDGNTSYWSPICAGAMLGVVDPLLWMSMLNYITGMSLWTFHVKLFADGVCPTKDSYPNCAGSAIAAFLIPSFLIAATCAHSGVAMFANLTTQTAFAILGGISVGVVILVYILYFFGPALRKRSKYAKTF